MTDGLLFVLSDPGTVPEAEFHDWYDSEHGPARLTVPGFRNGLRFSALDDANPPWLATYDLSLEALTTPSYTALLDQRSEREKAVLAELAVLDRRIYSLLSDHGTPASDAPSVVVATSMSVPAGTEDDFHAWYTTEHIPMLLEVPGWQRTRRYRLIEGEAPDVLALHEVASMDVFSDDRYRAAVSTPWREKVVGSATARERRVFGFRNAFRLA
jgi:hypothetical protein